MKGILLIIVSLCIYNTAIYSQETTSAMNELSKTLINTESGIWVMEGFNNNLYYHYVFQFSKDNKIIFLYSTCKEKYGTPWTTHIQRFGTFETDSNILTVNFTSASGSRYDKPKSWDEPIPENLSVKMEIEITAYKVIVKENPGKLFSIENPGYIPKDIEITEYKLIAKQVSGENIFEHHNEKARIELIAKRPIID